VSFEKNIIRTQVSTEGMA